MCTLFFLPHPVRPVLVSNRDESPLRPRAKKPELHNIQGMEFISPIDPLGGGSWVGVNMQGHTHILLNGAFERHEWRPGTYGKSRGIILIDLLSSAEPHVFWADYDLDQIEPFTLVSFAGWVLREWVWDGQAKHSRDLPIDRPAIWSSSTLYTAEAKVRKAALFEGFYNAIGHIPEALIREMQEFDDADNGFFIDRENAVKTLSTTIISYDLGSIEMEYRDYEQATSSKTRLQLKMPEGASTHGNRS